VTPAQSPDGRVDRFEQVYRSTRTEILAYLLRRTPQREDAADVLAEVYLTAWRRFDDLPDGDDARLWLYGTARRTLANHRRRDRNVRGIADRLCDELRASGMTRVALDATDANTAVVHDALGALDPGPRELLSLTAWEALTPRDIAVMTGDTPGTIRVRLHRARAQLRAELARRGIDTDDEPVALLAETRSSG
jgi:RNA polymerase sigma-70 factor, ECF subfamily